MLQNIQLYFLIIACLAKAQMEFPSRILNDLKVELGYESILLLQNSSDCWIDLKAISETPIINLNANQEYTLRSQFKRRFLALVCVEYENSTVLNALYTNLENMRDTATIFMINHRIDFQALLRNCLKNRMLNVLAIATWSPGHIYSYRAFPRFTMVKRSIWQVERYFEPQLKDMGGYPIVTMADNVFPRTVVYKDAQGHYQLFGYLTTFMENFAKTLNATLKISWDQKPRDNEVVKTKKITRLINTGTVDIPAIIINIALDPDFLNYSHVMEISKWQLMLPLESEIDRASLVFGGGSRLLCVVGLGFMYLFALLLHNINRLELGMAPSAWCLGALTDPVLRAMLYQTILMPRRPSLRLKYTYMLLLLCSFVCYNTYISQLETILVYPLTKPPIRSYQDMRRVGLKVMLADPDKRAMLNAIGQHVLSTNWDLHELVDSAVFQAMRCLPNASYAYPVTQTMWPFIERKFARQIRAPFRLSKDFTLLSLVPFAIPLSNDSIYHQALNRYILDTHASGLYAFWYRQNYYKLLSIGKTEELPYNNFRSNCLLSWTDLYYLWLIYICNVCLSLVIFAFELLMRKQLVSNGDKSNKTKE
ncbi:uncharacterized protein Ir60b [Drosophila montana]|uniref:uncharacterized protein Ir60b n=1 Tax=Drosophila montana TaxID=40370 RepID=UPI00313C0F0B